MKTLSIDTSSNKEIAVGLSIDGTEYQLKSEASRKAQVVLPLIDRLLAQHQVKLREIQAINVNPGPGSFTGLRVGIAIANILGLVLGLPVNGEKKTPVEPVYE